MRLLLLVPVIAPAPPLPLLLLLLLSPPLAASAASSTARADWLSAVAGPSAGVYEASSGSRLRGQRETYRTGYGQREGVRCRIGGDERRGA